LFHLSKGIKRKLFSNLFLTAVVASLLAVSGNSCSSNEPAHIIKSGNEVVVQIHSNEAVPVDSELVKKIQTFFENHFDETFFSGTVLIAKDDNIYYQACHGLGNYKSKSDSICLRSNFQLASATKPFTSYAILRQIHLGRLKLTDSVHNILPDFKYKGITVEMLLSHFSGLPNYMYLTDEYWGWDKGSISNNDVLSLFSQHNPSGGRPNSHFYYNNTNYLVLASIIEKLTGMSYDKYMKDSIFTPLGMNNTSIFNNVNREQLQDATYGHLGDLRPIYFDYLDGVMGDKGVFSNIYDLLKFDQALYDCKLVPCSLLEEAWKPRTDSMETAGGAYGLGWRLRNNKSVGKVIFHSGWWKGYRSLFIRVPQVHGTIIILTNTVRGRFFRVDDLVNLFAK
jgi:CubicO group peptidase (beta-lactamase class C family)